MQRDRLWTAYLKVSIWISPLRRKLLFRGHIWLDFVLAMIAVEMRCARVNILAKKPLFIPPPLFQKTIISSLFPVTKNSQNRCIWSPLARSAEIFEYLVLILAETIINCKKTGKSWAKSSENMENLSFPWSCLGSFLPCFWKSLYM